LENTKIGGYSLMEQLMPIDRICRTMSALKRFQTEPTLVSESLCDHATMLGLLIIYYSTCPEYKELFKLVNTEKLLKFALLHDAVETLTGDIPGNIKNLSPNGAKAFAQFELEALKEFTQGYPEDFQKEIYEATNLSNISLNNPTVLLFKLLDLLCVAIKTYTEAALGNFFFARVLENLHNILQKILTKIRNEKNTNKEHLELFEQFIENEFWNKYIKNCQTIFRNNQELLNLVSPEHM
jgi:5'-deoxynucleotidase